MLYFLVSFLCWRDLGFFWLINPTNFKLSNCPIVFSFHHCFHRLHFLASLCEFWTFCMCNKSSNLANESSLTSARVILEIFVHITSNYSRWSGRYKHIIFTPHHLTCSYNSCHSPRSTKILPNRSSHLFTTIPWDKLAVLRTEWLSFAFTLLTMEYVAVVAANGRPLRYSLSIWGSGIR